MVRLIIGFAIGIMISRNAQQYSTPYWGGIIFGALVGILCFYFFGRRDKNTAVATAVATAIANAKAEAEATATAVAQSAVQIFMQSGEMPTQREIAAYVDDSRKVEKCISEPTSLTSLSEESSIKPSSHFRSPLSR